jgi:hypothetical protein
MALYYPHPGLIHWKALFPVWVNHDAVCGSERLYGCKAEIVQTALLFPELSPRELAFMITDKGCFSVSESTVYRVLKRMDLIRPVEEKTFPTGPEFTVKTTAINQLWQTDASFLLVKNWGWYYLISVLDDFSLWMGSLYGSSEISVPGMS